MTGSENCHRIMHFPVTAFAINIPDDLLIAEVLARLPVKSVARFKCVQKSWKTAAETPWFVLRHLKFSRAMPPDVLVVPRDDCSDDEDEEIPISDEINLYRLREPLGKHFDVTRPELMLEAVCPEVIPHDILPTHCDGLVAIATATDQVFVLNPATKEFVTLPLGSHDVREVKSPAAALGFDPWRNRYVVARYFYQSYMVSEDEVTGELTFEYDIGHEVLTLGEGHSWKKTEDPPHAIQANSRPVCVGGAFYWCTRDLQLDVDVILRFNLCDEKFSLVPFPLGCYKGELAELAGKLCFVHTVSEETFAFWQLVGDGPEPEWSLRCRIDAFSEEIGTNGFYPVLSVGTKMLLAVDNLMLYKCYVWSDSMSEVVDLSEDLEYERQDGSKLTCGELGPAVYHVVPYVESLVSISQCNYVIPQNGGN
uniref:F-box associated beta-propeller type 3 domain-containing protein n=1 Tax=Leersia perrieri TaxID=77586 RepID=A0A0D9W448_9ORYZ